MIPLVKLKQDVVFNTDFTQVVDVMKGIATSKFYSLQKEQVSNAEFNRTVETILGQLELDKIDHLFLNPKNPRKGVLVVTSDTGFLGGLNTHVVHTALAEGGDNPHLMVMGDRGSSYLQSLTGGFEAFPGVDDAGRYVMALSVRDHILKHLNADRFGSLSVVYPRPALDSKGAASFTVQRVVVEEFIPCRKWVPQGKGLPQGVPMWWESHPADVLKFLVGKWMGQRLNEIFALSRLAELGARAMHLEGSHQELVRRGKKLHMDYQRARHELIDRSMREIFAAQILSKRTLEALEAAEAEEAEVR